jgi:hypothetical protein
LDSGPRDRRADRLLSLGGPADGTAFAIEKSDVVLEAVEGLLPGCADLADHLFREC